MFALLYSDKRNSRPNAPVNVIAGALILKELSGRTFSRFRERNAAYELVAGKDLIHDCMVSLAENIRRYMDIAPAVERMDRKSCLMDCTSMKAGITENV